MALWTLYYIILYRAANYIQTSSGAARLAVRIVRVYIIHITEGCRVVRSVVVAAERLLLKSMGTKIK